MNLSGKFIKEARINKEITQDMLAARMQTQGFMITRVQISKIENEKRYVTDLELAAFATVLGIGFAEKLLDRIKSEYPISYDFNAKTLESKVAEKNG